MEFLVLSPTPTWPPDLGNRKGIVALHNKLRESGRIHFVFYAAEGEWREGFDEPALEGMHRQWDSFHLVPPTRIPHLEALGADHEVDEWWDEAIGDYLSWRFARSQFDAFIVHYTWLSRAFLLAPKTVHKALYTADRFGDRRLMFEQRGFRREFFHLSVESEAEAISRADTVIAVKEREEEYFRGLCSKNVITVPHFEPDIAAGDPTASPVLKIGLIGGQNTINRENLREFLKVAEPIFARSFAPIEIIVAGGICDALLDVRSPFVKQIGYVEDPASFYASIDVAIVPMIWSSGIKIKYAEALAASKPLLATEHAAEGYPAPHPFMCCADFTELAKACVAVALDRPLLAELRAATLTAKRGARERFDESVQKLVVAARNWTPTFVLVAPEYVGETTTFVFHRLWDILAYLRGTVKLEILLPDAAGITQLALRKLQSVARVRSAAEIDDLARRAKGAIVMEWRGAAVDFCRKLQGDIFALAPPEAGVFDAAEHERRNQGAAVVYCGTRSDRHPRRDGFDHGRVIELPYFLHDCGPVARSWGQTPNYDSVIHVLASDGAIDFARSLEKIARDWVPHAVVEVISSSAQERRAYVDRFSRPGLAGPRPRLVIDLAPGELRATREIYERAAVPVIRYVPMTIQRDPGRDPKYETRLTAHTLRDLLYGLRTALLHPKSFHPYEELARFRARVKFQGEPGWALLRRRLSSMVDEHRRGLSGGSAESS